MKKNGPEKENVVKKKSKILQKIALVLGITILVAAILFLGFFLYHSLTKNKITLKKIKQQWNQYNYQEVYELTKTYLIDDPFNNTALTYNGYASFYLAVAQNDTYQAQLYLDDSIINMRLAIYNADPQLLPQLEYMLGKAYFYRNSISKSYYADLAVKYLTAAKEDGYESDDIAEYLGLSYASLGMTFESISAFSEALLYRESESLLLSIAEQYLKAGEYNASEQYLYRIINSSQNDEIIHNSKVLLGNLYIEKQDFSSAEAIFNEILAYDENSPDAHYALGLIYESQGNPIKARAEWRKTLKLQPNHNGALKKITE